MYINIKEIVFILIISICSAILFNGISSSGVVYLYEPPVVYKKTVLSLFETKRVFDSKEALFIDARPASQYKREYIPNAINVPYNSDNKESLMVGISKEENIIVYCYSKRCRQASRLADALRKMGYTQVALFEDGIIEWQKAKYAVERNGK